MTGGTTASDLPLVNPEMAKRGSGYSAFVTKFDPLGRVLWSSYIGGTTRRAHSLAEVGGDNALAIGVDRAGQVVIAGRTFSTDFPVVNAFISVPQATSQLLGDGFVSKLSSDGRRLIYSSYFGGGNGDAALSGLAVGPAGDAWVAGSSTSDRIATRFDVSNRDSNHVIVLKVDPAGSVVWSTRMSGAWVYDLAMDPLEQPLVAAGCWALQEGRFSFSCNPFVAKLSASGSQQLYREKVSTGFNNPVSVSVAADGRAVVAGSAGEQQPADAWPLQWGLGMSGSAFVRTLDSAGHTQSFNTVSVPEKFPAKAYAALNDGLIVAFNTATPNLPTEPADMAVPAGDAQQTDPLTFAMKVSRNGATSRTWALYLPRGQVFDVAATLSGEAIVLLRTQISDRLSEFAIVRISP